jgi:peptide deformylase
MLTPLLPKDPQLRIASEPVSPRQLRTKAEQAEIDQMLGYVYGTNNKGEGRDHTRPMTVGLSAPQIGIPKRISIVDLAIGNKGFSDIHVLVNPEIIWHSGARETKSEGCVNLPEIWGPISRWREVEVRALDRAGNRITVRAKGWAARLLQHEIDHLDGWLFIDHLTDPTKAHKVTGEQLKAYNKPENRLNWPHHIDVADLVHNKTTS